MPNPIYEKTPLAAAIAVAIGATPSSPVQAQEELEEVIVTGIRASLARSMDVKRDADGVVDAINAQDIGDFPDTNLAESLQRITGVSIDRDRGEGARVTVRGFGPQFNLVLLNGRQMPTSGGPSGGTDRSFDFADLASEAVSAVEVYKSGKADIPSGGIGSTINIKTTRPLDAPGLRMRLGAAGMYDESRTKREDSSWTGEISGIISNTFLDDKIGVSLTAIRQDREHGAAISSTGGWRSFEGQKHISWGAAPGVCNNPAAPADITPFVGQEEWGGIPIPCFDWEGRTQENRPDASDIYSVPQSIGYRLEDYDRTRTNGQLTFQFRPVESLTATLDYTFAEREESRTYNDLSAWFNFGEQETIWTDGDNVSPSTYREYLGAQDFAMGAGIDAFKNTKDSVGFNLVWDVTDRLMLELDYHDSTSESEPDSKWGSSALITIAGYTRDTTAGYFQPGKMPILELTLGNTLTPDDMVITGSTFQQSWSEMGIEQLRLSGDLEFDTGFIESIDFGVQVTDVDNTSQFSNVQRDAWFATTNEGAIEDLLTPASMSGAFSEIPGSGDSRRQLEYFTYNMAAMAARAEELLAIGDKAAGGMDPFPIPDQGPCGTGFCPTDVLQVDRRTLEESSAAYFQVNMATEWGNMPVDMRLGLRYEETDVTSKALVPTYNQIVWRGGNELVAEAAGQDFTTLTGDYDAWLPNFDFKIGITDDFVARFSYSETLTRPNYTAIQGGVTINNPLRINGGSGARGNPALLPYESENIDISFEYYYGDASYVSAGYFRKDVSNFIGGTIVVETVFDLPHPGLGPLADEAIAAGAVTSGEIYDWILTNRPNAEGVDAVNRTITGVAGRDPVSPFDLATSVNIDDVTVDGWELNLQHVFGDSGFGVIVNATLVDADVAYDINNLTEQFVIFGLSDSANFIPYYETDRWSIRVAYNWRDEFLAGIGQGSVGGTGPNFVDEYGQWDISANFWATDNLQLYADVINATDETTYVWGRQKDQVLFAGQYGTRYTLGLRYKF